jgi:hypothetical protein
MTLTLIWLPSAGDTHASQTPKATVPVVSTAPSWFIAGSVAVMRIFAAR